MESNARIQDKCSASSYCVYCSFWFGGGWLWSTINKTGHTQTFSGMHIAPNLSRQTKTAKKSNVKKHL
eukprot:2678979-Amphidinium_carterae.1